MNPPSTAPPLDAIPSSTRVRIARLLAVTADGIQIVAVPAFLSGAASPLNDALDLVVGVTMVLLVGWHVAFLPTFVTELIPFVDIFPTWTAAVFFVTRGGKRAGGPT